MTPSEEISRLRDELRKHEHLYYIANRPEISDYDFDQMMRRLVALEEKHPELRTPDSPSARVGGEPVDGFVTVVHDPPMLSIDNVYSFEELRDWDERVRKSLGTASVEYEAELKIDGVSIDLLYTDGVLTRAATRGDGVRGDDVTSNARTIRQLPLRIEPVYSTLEVRGEVYIDKRDFVKMNEQKIEEGEPPLANPRNTAAGAIRMKDPKQAAERRLRAFTYQVVRADDVRIESQMSAFEILRTVGLPVNPVAQVFGGLDELEEFIESWRERRHTLDFEIDGMVIKVNRRHLQQELGATSKAPRWAVAYKYPPEAARTVIRAIGAQVGRTGAITPVARFDAVHIGGTRVTSATLHNYEEVARKDVRIGDTVLVEKGGDVIPKVTEVVVSERPEGTEPVLPPEECPVCGQPVHRFEDEVAVRCVNQGCPAIARESILHFGSRRAMDIEGLGDKAVDALLAAGFVSDYSSLYALTKEQLLELPGYAETKATALLKAIDKSKDNELPRLIFAIGIRFVGERSAKLLAERFHSIADLAGATLEELIEVAEIGPKVAESIRFYFSLPANTERLERMRAAGVDPRYVPPARGTALEGKTFVVTGTLAKHSRDDIHRMIEAAGGKTSGSVSKKTSFLIAGDDAGSKLDKAKSLGVPVISEDEFLAMVTE